MAEDYQIKVKPLHDIVLDDFDPRTGRGTVNFWIPTYRDVYQMVQILKIGSGKMKPTLVDLGSGSGLPSVLLSRGGINVVAVDSDENLIAKAKETYSDHNVRFVAGDYKNIQVILDSMGVRKVDGVYCSFMPEGENWTPNINKLAPEVIFHVLRRQGRLATGTRESYNGSAEYTHFGDRPLITHLEFDRLDDLSPSTMSTGLIVQARRPRAIGFLQKGSRQINEAVSRIPDSSLYSWELGLERKIEDARFKTPLKT